MKYTLCFLALLTVIPVYAKPDYTERLENAVDVLNGMVKAPDSSVPHDLLDKSWCVIVVPGLKRGGFIVAARYGKGYVSCRKPTGAGWTAPGTVRIEGGSVGFQIGASENDIIMLVMNKKGMDRLFTDKFTLGADASIAAGPLGRTVAAQTGAFLTAEILAWSRSRGIFAGIALEGATLRSDKEDNAELYGKPLSNREIIEGNTPVPAPAKPMVNLLDKISPRRQP